MISLNDLSANPNGTSIAGGLMAAALFDLLIERGIASRGDALDALQKAILPLGKDFTGRPNEFNALRVIQSVMTNLAHDSQ
jgi:hypothetical protein